MKPHEEFRPALVRVFRVGLLVGLVAGVLCLLAGWLAPKQFFPAYLVAYWFWLSISLGCLAINMIHHLTGGGWGIPIRRILESASSTLVVMAVLFLPILLGMQTLFVWSDPEVLAHDQILQKKVGYLNVGFFQLRAAIYFAIWILAMLLVNLWTSSPNLADQERRRRPLTLVSGPGLVLLGLSLTFASVDWAMSLEPHWFSSMWGVIFTGGAGVAGLSFTILVSAWQRRYPPSYNVLTTSRLHDLGNLLLAFVMFWSYVSFMQYLIMWSGNLPEETPWYVRRSGGGWQLVAIGLIALHFFVPFLLLLSRQTKRNMNWLVGVAILLLAMRLIDLYWVVVPTFSESLYLSWPILITPAAIGGFWVAMFAWRLSVRGTIPVYEPHEVEEVGDEVAEHAAH